MLAYSDLLQPPAVAPASLRGRVFFAARQAAASAAALLYPPHCMACGLPLPPDGNGACCAGCAEKVAWIGTDRCRRCGEKAGAGRSVVESCPACASHPPAHVAQSCAVAGYDEAIRPLILGLKFSGHLQAVPLLSALLARRMAATDLLAGFAPGRVALVPVPLHARDFAARGFNQSVEIAARAARTLGVACEPRLLRKVRRTRPQAMLGAEARRENLRAAFAADAKLTARYAQGLVVLVDDVMTTGSTASECARTLHAAGLREIRAAFVARG